MKKFPSIIDRYIIRQFLSTFFFAIALLSVIIVIVDLSEKIDDFLTRGASVHAIIFDYYFNFLPFFITQYSYLFIFIAVVFFTSRLASRTEIIAMLNGGINFWRLLIPYVVTGLLLGVLFLVLSNFIIPKSNYKMREFEKMYYRNPFQNREVNIHMQISPGTFIYVENYKVNTQTGYKFTLEKFQDNKQVYKLTAPSIQWIDSLEMWRLRSYFERSFDGIHETYRQGAVIDTTLGFTNTEFHIDTEDRKIMNYWELNEFIEKEKLKGATNVETYEIEKYQRMMYPLTSLILTLMGISLSNRKTRGGIGIHLAVGLALAAIYILLMQFASMFSRIGGLTPLMGVMVPNLVFIILVVFLLYIAQK
ncbi:MAG: LptF/LptG family permease [Bacteroidales bacterium]|jgi:lipopolysaccharide export system permease protein|nr:LptF/LptG family permease [Bacteroidales bacterium]